MATVAVTRAARKLERDSDALASLLDLRPYDLKLRLRGPLPVIVADLVDFELADKLVETLRSLGHGAVSCGIDDVLGSDRMLSPRSFTISSEVFAGEHPAFGRCEIVLADLLALVRATHERRTRPTSYATPYATPMGPPLASGTRVFRSAEGYLRERRGTSDERSQVLYVFPRSTMAPIILRDTELRYGGLGRKAARTTGENFSLLTSLLRRNAPDARYDESLLWQRRKSGFSSARGGAASLVVSSSNTDATDLAAHLIAVAQRDGQI